MKCLCCGNDMKRYKLEEYQNMTNEEILKVISEHKEKCEWVENLKEYRELMKKGKIDEDDDSFIDTFLSLTRKVNVLYDILLENKLTTKEDFKKRLINRTKTTLDFEHREKLIKKLDKEYK